MKDKRTLYELLGVRPHATATEVTTAYRLALEALEAERGMLSSQDFNDRIQLLRVAHSTLSDPISRAGYDADLEAAARASAAALPAGSSSLALSSSTRADALGLRADALSLRADALMARADIDASLGRGDGLFSDWSPLTRRLVLATTLIVVLMLTTAGISRCSMNSARELAERREQMARQASEQAALQDYYQTYGVRPANMAELERLEAERRRKENAERQLSNESRRAEEERRRWEEESARRGEETSRHYQQAMEALRQEQQALKFEAEQLQLEISLATDDAERRRLQLRLRQLKERMKQGE